MILVTKGVESGYPVNWPKRSAISFSVQKRLARCPAIGGNDVGNMSNRRWFGGSSATENLMGIGTEWLSTPSPE